MSEAATTVVNARVFDGVTLRDWSSVRFSKGFITDCSTGSVVQDGDVVVDAAGGTLLPGLIDTHVHLAPGALAQSLNFGVTTVLDMFSIPEEVARARADASSRRDVADLRSSSIGATAPGGHPSALYDSFPTVAGPHQAAAFVDARVEEGADYLKVFSGVGGRWPALSAETISTLVRTAHSRGLIVVAHVSSPAGVEEILAAEADVIAHVPADIELRAPLIEQVAEAGVAVVPTLATIENTTQAPGAPSPLGGTWRHSMLGQADVRRLTSQGSNGRRRAPSGSYAEGTVRRMVAAGITVLAGTDAPNPGTTFGASLHRELELLVRSGMRATEALAAATSEPARTFGLVDRGRIAAGRRADLILVTGDPMANITAVRSIKRIWRGGILHHRRPFVPTAAEAEQLDLLDTRIAKVVASLRDRRRS